MMTKDVIYIDVEDDITTIVGKIKASKEKIIALVPPSRTGVLQSAVNMRLLQRSAELAKKRLVLISNNQSLAMLAAAAKIPVARNLQSKPELAEVPVMKMDGDEIINGETLPVGELARSASTSNKNSEAAINAAIKSSVIAEPLKNSKSASNKKKDTKAGKVPNFSSFRKKLFIIIGAALLLIGLLVWAIWFAPRATVTITAKTTSVTVNQNVGLLVDGETDVEASTIKALRQEQREDVSVEFTATGTKDVGNKATGRVRIETSAATILRSGLTVPAGTEIESSSGAKYQTTEAVVFEARDPSGLDGKVARVEAVAPGEQYNGARGSASTNARGVTSVTFVDATSGGTSREVTVVSEEDLVRATDMLREKNPEGLKDRLTSSFGSSSVVIDESYNETRSNPISSVAVDAEAGGPVTLSSTVTATMYAIDEVDLKRFLEGSIEAEIEGRAAQRIYEDGAAEVRFAQFTNRDDSMSVRITANGTVGPEVEEDQVKELARGKSYGDIQVSLEAIEGVDDVDTQFWPFWVRTVPDDVNRIMVEFKLDNAD